MTLKQYVRVMNSFCHGFTKAIELRLSDHTSVSEPATIRGDARNFGCRTVPAHVTRHKVTTHNLALSVADGTRVLVHAQAIDGGAVSLARLGGDTVRVATARALAEAMAAFLSAACHGARYVQHEAPSWL